MLRNVLCPPECPLIRVYGTERELGIALKESKIPRSEFWVTTKIFGSVGDVEKGLRTSLEKLQLEYVDLYLIHAPFFPAPPLEEVWKGMEGVLEKGIVVKVLVDGRIDKEYRRLELQNTR